MVKINWGLVRQPTVVYPIQAEVEYASRPRWGRYVSPVSREPIPNINLEFDSGINKCYQIYDSADKFYPTSVAKLKADKAVVATLA